MESATPDADASSAGRMCLTFVSAGFICGGVTLISSCGGRRGVSYAVGVGWDTWQSFESGSHITTEPMCPLVEWLDFWGGESEGLVFKRMPARQMCVVSSSVFFFNSREGSCVLSSSRCPGGLQKRTCKQKIVFPYQAHSLSSRDSSRRTTVLPTGAGNPLYCNKRGNYSGLPRCEPATQDSGPTYWKSRHDRSPSSLGDTSAPAAYTPTQCAVTATRCLYKVDGEAMMFSSRSTKLH